MNRAAGLLIPLVMGGIAQWFGLAAAFWSTGAMLISALLLVGLLHRRQVPHAGPEKFRIARNLQEIERNKHG